MRSGAYCNLNDIATPFGKRIDNWTRLKGVQELFVSFKEDPCYEGQEPIIASKGGYRQHPSDLRDVSDRGTFAHPDVAIQFAQPRGHKEPVPSLELNCPF